MHVIFNVLLLFVSILVFSCCKSVRENHDDIEAIVSKVNLVVESKIRDAKSYRVESAIYRNEWFIQIYVDSLTRDEMEEIQSLIFGQVSSSRGIDVVYLTNQIEVDGRIIRREDGTSEILARRKLGGSE